jgi:hypothetical protein
MAMIEDLAKKKLPQRNQDIVPAATFRPRGAHHLVGRLR